MEICARCKKNKAVIFITRIEGEKTTNEGLCMKCARELGIKPVSDMIEKLGLSDEDLERMDSEMEGLMEMSAMSGDEEPSTDGKTPPLDISKLFGQMSGLFGNRPQKRNEQREEKKEIGDEKE